MPSSVRPLPPRGCSSNLSTLKEEDDAALFEAPSELVCPITHAVFLDPVLTLAGHAYERKAIEQHLQSTDTDHMSRQPLLNSSLTPVFVLKSRALQYRETTCRSCIDRACSPNPPRPPIDYLRRTVELCSDAGFLPKGLTSEVVTYVNSHVSNVYDRLALEFFARGLYENGYRDRAAAIYFHLLVSEEDKTAQAEMLKRCLACWQAQGNVNPLSLLPSTPSEGGDSSSSGSLLDVSTVSRDVDSHVFANLVHMIEKTNKTNSYGWIIDISSEANLGNTFIARLCKHILFPQRNIFSNLNATTANSTASVSLQGKGNCTLPWEVEKEVLLKYCFVLTAEVKEEVAEMKNTIRKETALISRNGGGTSIKNNRNSLSKFRGKKEGDSSNEQTPITDALIVLSKIVRHPYVMVPCAAIAILGNPHNPIVRSTFVLPFLALMQNSSHGGNGSDGGGGSPVQSQSPSVEVAEEALGHINNSKNDHNNTVSALLGKESE